MIHFLNLLLLLPKYLVEVFLIPLAVKPRITVFRAVFATTQVLVGWIKFVQTARSLYTYAADSCRDTLDNGYEGPSPKEGKRENILTHS